MNNKLEKIMCNMFRPIHRTLGFNLQRNVYLKSEYMFLWNKTEREARKGWSTLPVLLLANPTREPFTQKIDVLPHKNPSSPFNPNISHFHRGPHKTALILKNF